MIYKIFTTITSESLAATMSTNLSSFVLLFLNWPNWICQKILRFSSIYLFDAFGVILQVQRTMLSNIFKKSSIVSAFLTYSWVKCLTSIWTNIWLLKLFFLFILSISDMHLSTKNEMLSKTWWWISSTTSTFL